MLQRLFYISILLGAIISCSDTVEHNRIDTEKSNIENWIDQSGIRATEIGGVYRLELSASPLTAPQLVEKGDSIYLNYAIFTFSSLPETLIDTNIRELAIDQQADTMFMNFDVKRLKYGTSDMINGLSKALAGSSKGASYAVVIPYEYGYGDKINGQVDSYTTLYIEYEVLDVIK